MKDKTWPLASVVSAAMLLVVGIILSIHILLLPDALFERLDKRIGVIGGWLVAVAGFLGISVGFGGPRQFFSSRPVRVCIGVLFFLCLITLLPIGAVNVNSSPQGAAVRLDQETETRGMTPATISWLSIKPHTVRLSLDGYETVSHKVPFGTILLHKEIEVALRRLSGTIAVSTDPPGAVVFVDQETEGHSPTPLEIGGVAVGVHRLRIEKGGYETIHLTDVNVENGQISTVSRPLVKTGEYSSIQVHSIPPGAKIVVRGKRYGNAPLAIRLVEGEHLIEAEIDGVRKEKRVTIPKQTAVTFLFE